MRHFKKPHFLISWTLLHSVRLLTHHKSHMSSNIDDIKSLKPPYLILANHLNNWDPLYINSMFDEPICFLAGERLFRKNRFLRSLLHYIGTIPIVKSESDFLATRRLMRAKKANRIICVFPEGNRAWDGVYRHPVKSTGKLVKMLKIPVVTVKIKGALLTQPRWAKTYRKGPIELEFQTLFTGDDLKSLSKEAIFDKINLALSHDDYQWVASHHYHYQGKKLAEGLESFLYICHHCGAESSMTSHHNAVTCSVCGTSYSYDLTGRLKKDQDFISPKSWNDYQRQKLATELRQGHQIKAKGHLVISTPERRPLKRYHGQMIFDKTGLDMGRFKIPFERLKGVNIQKGSQFEFRYHEKIHTIEFDRYSDSVYKWYEAYLILKGAYNE